jgi:hypothetical protein
VTLHIEPHDDQVKLTVTQLGLTADGAAHATALWPLKLSRLKTALERPQ